jgi:chromosome segregation protein
MLKALELIGFKSFADKTRLEFPPGVTVVVGPNGSGKSNIVDAIKWVLGEQSVKSLRGKEMADVIFNGSASRRALNSAESTLTFDNKNHLLAIDAAEVHITRRVYRSGEGEYLINRQPCRLRDIRDLFAGTGVATEAYSVIEQGKVDVLLQSSPRERRLIFEEAAGISRFKAKKVEALRRLERVEQNLLRLSDIVDEVDNRVRTVRMQATKARKYKEYSDRLQALRTQVGASDWRRLSDQLAKLEQELKEAQDENVLLSSQAETLETQAFALDSQISDSETEMRATENRVGQNRERIAAHESSIEHERRRTRDLDEEVARYRRQLTSMSTRAVDLHQQIGGIEASLSQAEGDHREVARRLAEEERHLTRLTAQVDEIRAENERRRASHLEQMRSASVLASQTSALESRVVAAEAVRTRSGRRLAELAATRESLAAELVELRQSAAALEAACEVKQMALESVQASLAEHRAQAVEAQQDLGHLRERSSGASERAAVLEELEKRLEGVSAGVKQVLVESRGAVTGPLTEIRGLVADLLRVSVDDAPLVEIALGETAQCLVVASSTPWLDYLASAPELAGRVGFVRLDPAAARNPLDSVDLYDQLGVLRRADDLVECDAEFVPLARRLLGRTWIVESLAHAVTLSAGVGRGLNFITQAGEMLLADGMLYAGPRHTTTGLISRRSELRVLARQIADLASQINVQVDRCAQLDAQVAGEEREAQRLAGEFREVSQQHSHQRSSLRAAEERQSQLDKQFVACEMELSSAETEFERATLSLAETREQLAQVESALADLETRLQEGASQASHLDQARQRFSREASVTKIEVVKSEQRLSHLRAQRSQLERDHQERGRALADGRSQLEVSLERLRDSERNILGAESELAELYLRKESFAAEAARQLAERDEWRQRKAEFTTEAQRVRGKIRKLEARLHAQDLAAGEVRHERTTLADRLREDYGIELAELEHEPSAEELQERTDVEREITELRSKLNSIGGVNLDALAELDELEVRFNTLSGQHQDLSSAKASLEAIINKINADSRRLFADTLEVVREHFQGLFRKLFGGGHADIILDEGVDILDSGIEIIARPPGKEPRNISLLSGGEKTLTCVALLLAIFRSRPSPFCVLDEVDAALDEANIERFIGVLQEFLAWTQFIVVTHSKKTMTCASTLYGITMQESGISKRVSVRFEDVSDNGEILNVREDDEAATSDDETQAA